MKTFATLALLISIIGSSAGCAQMNSGCDGFSSMRMKSATAAYLVLNDIAFADEILAHNEFGEKKCGWKAPGG